jgi:hypothetical protein
MMNHNRLSPFFIISIFFMTSICCISCRQIPSTPEALAKKIAEDLMHADDKASGVFYDATQQLDDEHLVVLYVIARQDSPDDPWRSNRDVHFLFRPSTDPEAPDGWYLERIAGEYLDFLGIGEGVQFEWDYEYFQTVNGPREGIVGLGGIKKIRL